MQKLRHIGSVKDLRPQNIHKVNARDVAYVQVPPLLSKNQKKVRL